MSSTEMKNSPGIFKEVLYTNSVEEQPKSSLRLHRMLGRTRGSTSIHCGLCDIRYASAVCGIALQNHWLLGGKLWSKYVRSQGDS